MHQIYFKFIRQIAFALTQKIMKESTQTITIRQIAEKANVSIGTVDRILHNRGRVSEVTKQSVLNIIKELGYKPNIHASLLSIRKSIRIIVIIPYFQSEEFWSLVYEFIKKAEREHSTHKLSIDTLYYNQFDSDSFNNACGQCISLNPDGVILSPIHKEASARFVQELSKQGTPVVFVDTYVEKCDYFAYFGIDLFASAYLAADLMFQGNAKINKIANFNIKTENNFYSEAFHKREQGLIKYMKDHKINCEIINCMISPSDFLKNINIFDEFFKQNPDVHHAITMTSRIHIITDWMDIRKKKDLHIIGYDMTPANIRALRKGAIEFLIAQRTDIEAYSAAKALIDYLTLGLKPEKKDNLFPIDILTKYNIDYYIH